MLISADLQINHPDYYQLRYVLYIDGEAYECFATAPKFVLVPSQNLVTIQCLGVQYDVMISPADVDDEALSPFLIKAVEQWVLEMSLSQNEDS